MERRKFKTLGNHRDLTYLKPVLLHEKENRKKISAKVETLGNNIDLISAYNLYRCKNEEIQIKVINFTQLPCHQTCFIA
jgi:hypothetical protein